MPPYNDYQTPFGIRTAAVLTNAFVTSDTIIDNVQYQNQLILEVNFTLGSLTTGEIKVEFSHDKTTWFQETYQSLSGGSMTHNLGTHLLPTDMNGVIAISSKYKFIRVSAKGNGTVTGSSMAIRALVGNV